MQHLLTLEEALEKAKSSSDLSSSVNQEDDTEDEPKLSKIGKVQAYRLKPKEDDQDYIDIKNGSIAKADVILAGEDNFIIDKTQKIKIDNKEVYLAVNDYDKDYKIYVDDNGILYTDETERAGLLRKILQEKLK